MNPVGTHGQGCLGDDEYGAVALAMQCNRDAVDAALTADQAALDGYNNRPWLQAVSTSTVTQAQTLTEWVPGDVFPGFQVMGASGGATSTITSSGMAASLFTQFTTGWWNIGGYASYQPTGAVTNFSRRVLAVQVGRTVLFNNEYETVLQTAYESNTGTDSMTCQGMFFLDSQYTYFVNLMFAHRNSGSTVQINTGARIWMNFLGSGVTI